MVCKIPSHRLKVRLQLKFVISQHSLGGHDELLMESLVSYFGCSRYVVRNNKEFGEFIVTNFWGLHLNLFPYSINIQS